MCHQGLKGSDTKGFRNPHNWGSVRGEEGDEEHVLYRGRHLFTLKPSEQLAAKLAAVCTKSAQDLPKTTGLFARCYIHKDALIGYYRGYRLRPEFVRGEAFDRLETSPDGLYVMVCRDASPDGFPRYINCDPGLPNNRRGNHCAFANASSPMAAFETNAKLAASPGCQLSLRATKGIFPGEEIITSYSANYWSSKRVQALKKMVCSPRRPPTATFVSLPESHEDLSAAAVWRPRGRGLARREGWIAGAKGGALHGPPGHEPARVFFEAAAALEKRVQLGEDTVVEAVARRAADVYVHRMHGPFLRPLCLFWLPGPACDVGHVDLVAVDHEDKHAHVFFARRRCDTDANAHAAGAVHVDALVDVLQTPQLDRLPLQALLPLDRLAAPEQHPRDFGQVERGAPDLALAQGGKILGQRQPRGPAGQHEQAF